MKCNIRYHCPFCPAMGLKNTDLALSVNWQKGVYKCFRCGTTGRVSSLPPGFKKPLIYKPPEKEERREELRGMVSLTESARGRVYIERRGLDSTQLSDYVFISENKKYLIFPIYKGGEIVYYVSRKMWGSGRRYNNMRSEMSYLFHPYGAIRHASEPLVITEGIFDCLSVYQWTGLYSIALLGKESTYYKISRILEITKKYTPIIILLDSDAYDTAIYYKSFLISRPETFVIPLEEGDPNSIGKEQLWKKLTPWASSGTERGLRSIN